MNYNNCSCVCVLLCTNFVHNTAQNSSDDLPSYPPHHHHCSDAVTILRITDMITVYGCTVYALEIAQ